MSGLILPIVIALALAVVCGFWYSYYQSVKKLKAHDRETVRLMQEEVRALEQSGASLARIAGATRKLDEFRSKHHVG